MPFVSTSQDKSFPVGGSDLTAPFGAIKELSANVEESNPSFVGPKMQLVVRAVVCCE